MRVERVVVYADKVRFRLRLAPEEPRRTSEVPGLGPRVLGMLPGLAGHRCTGGEGVFAEELADTEVAHLFEHVVLELMLLAGQGVRFEGTTAWDAGHLGRGVYHVSVAYTDDVVCLAAGKVAAKVFAHLVEGARRPDMAEEVEELRRLAGRPPELA